MSVKLSVGEPALAGETLSAEEVLARQDRIPVWTLPRRYLAVIGLGYFFTFFDIANIGYAMPAIAEQFKLSDSEALFVALALVPNFEFGWRLMFVIGGLIASVGLIARFQLPESPRWRLVFICRLPTRTRRNYSRRELGQVALRSRTASVTRAVRLGRCSCRR